MDMKLSDSIVRVALLLAIQNPPIASAEPVQPMRWVLADQVRVRSGPSTDHPVSGALSRGAELVLKAPADGEFCSIEGEGQFGYVACKYLSAERIGRPRSGENGVDAAQRWVSINGVTLREKPDINSKVAGRLPLNAILKLVNQDAGNGYCQVQLADGASGYTACRYLAMTAAVSTNFQATKVADKGMPDDVTMLGDVKPAPYADWIELKRKALAQQPDEIAEWERVHQWGKTVSVEVQQRLLAFENLEQNLRVAMGLGGPVFDKSARASRLISALEFPSIQPSLFQNEGEIAPPSINTYEASGRFGIQMRQTATSRILRQPSPENDNSAGPYESEDITTKLVRPVQRVQLFRDGRLRTESSQVFIRRHVWYYGDVMCEDYRGDGFAFGDADASTWGHFGGARKKDLLKQKGVAEGSLFLFYTTSKLQLASAGRTEIPVKLDRDKTGFVRGVHLQYDLDGDGIPDIAVWEGQGKGPGHLDGPTQTDDRWYRLALVNIAGKWKVLGTDVFSYGCGC
jgi:uncharacterized protein YgiM (DUF1202 family)